MAIYLAFSRESRMRFAEILRKMLLFSLFYVQEPANESKIVNNI